MNITIRLEKETAEDAAYTVEDYYNVMDSKHSMSPIWPAQLCADGLRRYFKVSKRSKTVWLEFSDTKKPECRTFNVDHRGFCCFADFYQSDSVYILTEFRNYMSEQFGLTFKGKKPYYVRVYEA